MVKKDNPGWTHAEKNCARFYRLKKEKLLAKLCTREKKKDLLVKQINELTETLLVAITGLVKKDILLKRLKDFRKQPYPGRRSAWPFLCQLLYLIDKARGYLALEPFMPRLENGRDTIPTATANPIKITKIILIVLNINTNHDEIFLRHFRDNGETTLFFPGVFNLCECLREIRRLLTGTDGNRAHPYENPDETVKKLLCQKNQKDDYDADES